MSCDVSYAIGHVIKRRPRPLQEQHGPGPPTPKSKMLRQKSSRKWCDVIHDTPPPPGAAAGGGGEGVMRQRGKVQKKKKINGKRLN